MREALVAGVMLRAGCPRLGAQPLQTANAKVLKAVGGRAGAAQREWGPVRCRPWTAALLQASGGGPGAQLPATWRPPPVAVFCPRVLGFPAPTRKLPRQPQRL